MTREDLVNFAARDWAAIEHDKARYWAERKREMSPAEALRVGDDLRRHAKMIQPDWPSERERLADRESHSRVAEALRAVPYGPR